MNEFLFPNPYPGRNDGTGDNKWGQPETNSSPDQAKALVAKRQMKQTDTS